MRLDSEGYAGLLAFMRAHGYTGTLDQWREALALQQYGADIRKFETVSKTALAGKYPVAQAFIDQVLALAKNRFDGVRVRDAYDGLTIDFSRQAARRQEQTPRPLKLDGLALDIDFHENRVQIRCRLYVNTEFRRDRHFTFLMQSSTPASKGCQ